jgi:hypothetical protein
MAKWKIPDFRCQKRVKELEEALEAYLETDETPEDEPGVFGDIKRTAIALLQKGGPR